MADNAQSLLQAVGVTVTQAVALMPGFINTTPGESRPPQLVRGAQIGLNKLFPASCQIKVDGDLGPETSGALTSAFGGTGWANMKWIALYIAISNMAENATRLRCLPKSSSGSVSDPVLMSSLAPPSIFETYKAPIFLIGGLLAWKFFSKNKKKKGRR